MLRFRWPQIVFCLPSLLLYVHKSRANVVVGRRNWHSHFTTPRHVSTQSESETEVECFQQATRPVVTESVAKPPGGKLVDSAVRFQPLWPEGLSECITNTHRTCWRKHIRGNASRVCSKRQIAGRFEAIIFH